MSTAPHDLGPVDDLLLCSFEEAEPAVRRWALQHLERLPWVRVLGPWKPKGGSRSWHRRVRAGSPERTVWNHSGVWWARTDLSVRHATRNAAMAAEDRAAQAEGWLFDPSLPPEEEPEAPADDGWCRPCNGTGQIVDGLGVQQRCSACNGTGREGFLAGIARRISEQPQASPAPVATGAAQRHTWAVHTQRGPGGEVVQRCTRCDRLRCSGALLGMTPPWRHFATTAEINEALRGNGTGTREAGPCLPREGT